MQDIEGAKFNFGENEDELKDLYRHMEKVPLLKQAILSHFNEYAAKNQTIIQAAFNHSEDDDKNR